MIKAHFFFNIFTKIPDFSELIQIFFHTNILRGIDSRNQFLAPQYKSDIEHFSCLGHVKLPFPLRDADKVNIPTKRNRKHTQIHIHTSTYFFHKIPLTITMHKFGRTFRADLHIRTVRFGESEQNASRAVKLTVE